MTLELGNNAAKILLSEDELDNVLNKMASEILELIDPNIPLVIVGLASRGAPLGSKLKDLIKNDFKSELMFTEIDATFYRDDLHTKRGFKLPSIPSMNTLSSMESLTDCQVLLVDDVSYTGRSARAALNALMDFGRPKLVRYAVLVDRDQRELPIRPDIIGLTYKTKENEEIKVRIRPIDSKEEVVLISTGDQ